MELLKIALCNSEVGENSPHVEILSKSLEEHEDDDNDG